MARNASVTKFQRVMASLPPAATKALKAEVLHQALVLRGNIAAAAPRGATGALAASVRVTPATGSKIAAVVRAGGQGTTSAVGSGFLSSFRAAVAGRGTYDYAIAMEFGTQHLPAQPFFWPTYRANKRRMRAAIKAEAVDAIGKLVPLT